MDSAAPKHLADLKSASEIVLGRLNGLTSLLIVMARNMPPDIASKCACDAHNVLAYLDAALVASPSSDVMAEEMLRVVSEGILVFEQSASSLRP